MNREEQLNKRFPLEDGTTYIQSIDKSNELIGAGAGGESIKENFIDSSPISLEASPNTFEESASVDSSDKRDIDFMYKWIRKHSNK